ncbi:MAG: DUF418 domain-containing protein [Chitinophagaceae bacterium]|nr:DUF418 domain-containing protein [Chitinophagaceae bacterium]
MPETKQQIGPLGSSERIVILDSLRGIAVLGILLMNIPGFGLPHIRVHDFTINNESGLNYYAWYVFGPGVLEGSQRAIFSMLFGAGTLIFINRLEKRTDGLMPAELFFRRQLWLLVFGLFNAFVLLWFWDILYHYAICGMILFAFRRLKPKHLFIAAGVCLLFVTIRENRDLYEQKAVITKGEKIAAIDTTKVKLTDEQKDDLGAMERIRERSKPEARKKRAEKEVKDITGNYAGLYEVRSDMSAEGELEAMYYFLIWDILLFMFIGMAFFKLGILQGEGKTAWYAWMAVIGLGAGLPLSYLFLQPDIANKFNYFLIIKKQDFNFYEIQRLVRSIGIFGLIMLMYKSGWFKWLFSLMRPVGQMAFSNYLLQSIICGLIFYGVGFGMFGKLQRYEIYYVVGSVWIFEIILSHIWMRNFLFGPFEWVWRSLTYWKKQPFKKNKHLATTLPQDDENISLQNITDASPMDRRKS